MIKQYHTRTRQIPGTSYSEVYQKAFGLYKEIRKKTKRRPYVRSAYFNKQKIFLPLFWSHLHEKLNHRDKTRRAKLFPCTIELIQRSRFDPMLRQNPDRPNELLHRFAGRTKDNQSFFVQIKEDKRTGEKWLISAFPE